MTYEQEFLKDFEGFVIDAPIAPSDEFADLKIRMNEMALQESQKVYEEDQDERAKEAAIRYESRLDAYQFLLGKFANYQEGKGFHDLPDGLFGQRNY